jgi:hypothetical protein
MSDSSPPDITATLAHEIIYLEIKVARLQGKNEDEIKRQALVSYFGLLCRLKGIDPNKMEDHEIKTSTENINKAIGTMLEQETWENTVLQSLSRAPMTN